MAVVFRSLVPSGVELTSLVVTYLVISMGVVCRSLVPSGVELTSLEVACLAQVLIAAIPKERAFIPN